MSFEDAIVVEGLSKCYEIYDQPRDRLKQFVFRRLQRLAGLPQKRYYKEFWALHNVNLCVRKGETVGIVGKNGSGKSTLLQLICNTLHPTSGSITLSGRVAALLELGSGFNPEFTGRENVYLNGNILGLTRSEIETRFDQIVAFADIDEFIDRPVKTYSSGMMLRLAFAVASNADPEILIIDEALAVGDELFQRKCFSRLETIRSRGATVLFVSHSGAQIVDLCDRAVLLDEGEMVAVGAAKDIVCQYQRLLYAPANHKAQVRAKIVAMFTDGVGVPDAAEIAESIQETDAADACGLFEETYDPHLIPATTVEYESHGPLIGTPEILTLDGRRVNGLVRGRRYRYCYKARFNRSANTVRFGMAIKSMSGVSYAGALSTPGWSSALPVVEQGSTAEIEFLFDCNFNPGTYFLNAGVFGLEGDTEVVLHRRADVAAFRVLPVVDNIETETVYLKFKPSVVIHV